MKYSTSLDFKSVFKKRKKSEIGFVFFVYIFIESFWVLAVLIKPWFVVSAGFCSYRFYFSCISQISKKMFVISATNSWGLLLGSLKKIIYTPFLKFSGRWNFFRSLQFLFWKILLQKFYHVIILLMSAAHWRNKMIFNVFHLN